MGKPPRKQRSGAARSKWSYILLGVWASFSVSLTVWWYIYSQQQVKRLLALDTTAAEQLARHQSMLMWEGAALIVSLIVGALVVAQFIVRDQRQSRQIVDFFLTFAHEVKTPLTSLRLQAESLEEQLESPEARKTCQGLIREANRLSLQLENSLWLANLDRETLLCSPVQLQDVVDSVQFEFPDLRIDLSQPQLVKADPVALRIVLRNIARNAILHGKASQLALQCASTSDREVHIEVQDNGKGYDGDPSLLGTPFLRTYSGSGTGVGLYICKRLIEKMKGELSFVSKPSSFALRLALPSAALAQSGAAHE